MSKRHYRSIDLCSHTVISYLSMHRIGKIKRCSVTTQAHNLAFWRKHKDLVLKKIDSQIVQKLVRVINVVFNGPVKAFADPVNRRVNHAVF